MKSNRNIALWMVALITVMGLTVSACGQTGAGASGGGQEDGQAAAPGNLGGPPDHAGGAAAQRGLQRPAARDEPLGGLG